MARAQINQQLPTVKPNATATPSFQSVLPAVPAFNDPWGQVGQALGVIGGVVNTALTEREERLQREAADAAASRIQGMTFEEAKAAVKSGELKQDENPWFDAAFRKQFGIAAAAKRKRDLTDAYTNEFDPLQGDVESFLAERVKGDLEAYQGDKMIMAGWREGMGGFLNQLKDDAAQKRIDAKHVSIGDNFYKIASDAATTALGRGKSPAAAIRSLYADNKKMLGLSYREMDAITLQIAKERAEAGDLRAVQDILSFKPKGSDGVNAGSFLDRASTADQANAILATAEAAAAKNELTASVNGVATFKARAAQGALTAVDESAILDMAERGVLTPAAAASIISQNRASVRQNTTLAQETAARAQIDSAALDASLNGKAAGLRDLTINGKTYTAKEQRKTVVNNIVEGLRAKEAEVPEIAAVLSSTGIEETYEPWVQTMQVGVNALENANVTADKDGNIKVPLATISAFELYNGLASTPRLRDRHIPDPVSREILRDAEVLVRNGVPVEDALARAGRARRDERGVTLTGRFTSAQLQTAVNTTMDSFWAKDVLNKSQISRNMEVLARNYIGLGVQPDAALQAAAEDVDNSWTNINGWAINTRNLEITPDFPEVAETFINSYADEHDLDAEDLFIAPTHDGTGRWFVGNKGPGGDLSGIFTGRYVTMEEIRRPTDTAVDAEREAAIKEVQAKIEKRRKAVKSASRPASEISDERVMGIMQRLNGGRTDPN